MSDEDAPPPPTPAPPPPTLAPTRVTARQATSALAFEAEALDTSDPLLDFAPYLHKQPRANSITPDVQRRFIAELRACGVVTQAARKVGKSMEALYNLRERPGAEGFKAAWEEARRRFGERLHDFASARVMEGDMRAVVSGGKLLGWNRVYDYPTIRFMLKHNMPGTYGEAALLPGGDIYEAIKADVLAEEARRVAALETPEQREAGRRERAIALYGYDPEEGEPEGLDGWDEEDACDGSGGPSGYGLGDVARDWYGD